MLCFTTTSSVELCITECGCLQTQSMVDVLLLFVDLRSLLLHCSHELFDDIAKQKGGRGRVLPLVRTMF